MIDFVRGLGCGVRESSFDKDASKTMAHEDDRTFGSITHISDGYQLSNESMGMLQDPICRIIAKERTSICPVTKG